MGAAAGKLDNPACDQEVQSPVRRVGRAGSEKGSVVRVAYLNCRGLKGKVVDIVDVAQRESFDVVAMTETHVREGEQEQIGIPEGYSFTGKGRDTGQRKGGGVGFLIRKGVQWHRIFLGDEDESEVRSEMQWIGIESAQNKIACGVVYVGREGLPEEWNDQIFERLRVSVTAVQEQGYKVMLVGDFNGHIGDGMEGIDGGDKDVNRNGRRLLRFSREFGLRILNRDMDCKGKWTWSAGDRKSIIDYVLVDDGLFRLVEKMCIDEEGDMDVGSDHNWMSVVLKCVKKVRKAGSFKWVWCIDRETDWNTYREKLRRVLGQWRMKWVDGDLVDVQGMSDDLKRKIFEVAKETIGRKKVPSEGKGYRIDTELKRAIGTRRVKNRAWRLARRNREEREIEAARDEYMEAREKVNKMKAERRAKRNEEMTRKVMSSGAESSSVFWKHVTKRKKNQVDRLTHRGKVVEGESGIREALRDHWREVNDPRWGEGEPPTARSESRHDRWEQELCEKIRLVEVEIAIDHIKAGKAPGPDGVLNEFIKKGPVELWDSMCWMFNKVLEVRETPREWRELKISYIPKKGSIEQLDQCRGIAIASNIGKIFARVMYKRLGRVVEREGMLGEIQNGFRPGRRVVDHVFTLSQVLEMARKRRKKVYMAFLDVRKAYDRVWREALWGKMEGLGFGGRFLDVLKALYSDVKCTLSLGEVEAGEAELNIGLKQGCVLSPILFALYLRELGEKVIESGKGVKVGDMKIPGLFFADDVVLMANTKDELQDLLRIAGEYGEKWRLEYSEKKSQVMILGQKCRPGETWEVGKFKIPEGQEKVIRIGEVEEYEYLGVTIKATGQGMFRYHMDKVRQKVNRSKGMIKLTAGNSFNKVFTGRVLWERVAIPGMLYGLDVMSISEKDMDWMEKVQNEMGKWLLGAPPCVATEAVLGELGWIKVRDRIAKAKLNYWGYLQEVGEDRWCRKVYLEALKEHTKWIVDIDKLAESYELKGPGEIDTAWKTYVRKVVTEKHHDQWKQGVNEKSTLRAYRVLGKPVKGRCWDGSKGSRLLFKGRAGVINLEKRKQKWTNGSDGKCKVCGGGEDETIDHFLSWCPAYQGMRDSLFERWKQRDGLCESLGQVQGMTESERLAWMLGMKGGLPGSRWGMDSVKDFLVECWDRRGAVLGLNEAERRVSS